MAQKDIAKTMASAVADAIKFASERGETIISGAEAVTKAEAIENRDFSRGGGFEEGDIIMFPSSREELEECCLLAGEKSVSFVLPIERKGKVIALRVYAQWFTLCTHPLGKDGKEIAERWLSHKGTFAENARAYQGSIFGLFESFLNRKVKVTKVERLECLVYKKNQTAPNPATGKYDREPGRRKFYSFEEMVAEEEPEKPKRGKKAEEKA